MKRGGNLAPMPKRGESCINIEERLKVERSLEANRMASRTNVKERGHYVKQKQKSRTNVEKNEV